MNDKLAQALADAVLALLEDASRGGSQLAMSRINALRTRIHEARKVKT